MLGALFRLFFHQPDQPLINLPITIRMVPHIRQTITQAFTLAYERGVYDGIIAGVLLSLLLLPSLRSQIIKGAANVIDHA